MKGKMTEPDLPHIIRVQAETIAELTARVSELTDHITNPNGRQES